MMSPGFIETFNKHLAQFKDSSRRKEYEQFLLALVEWQTCQMVVGMLKVGISDFGRDPCFLLLNV